jgi:hypothetical protein
MVCIFGEMSIVFAIGFQIALGVFIVVSNRDPEPDPMLEIQGDYSHTLAETHTPY